MVLLPHHIDTYPDGDGLPSVAVTFDLTPGQLEATLHALRIAREARFRVPEISTDDALALFELTSLVDVVADLTAGEGIGRVQMTVARLGVLRGGLAEFLSGEHLEREGDDAARPEAFEVLDAVEDLHARAVRAALDSALPTSH